MTYNNNNKKYNSDSVHEAAKLWPRPPWSAQTENQITQSNHSEPPVYSRPRKIAKTHVTLCDNPAHNVTPLPGHTVTLNGAEWAQGKIKR
jgi:hypothetical protein